MENTPHYDQHCEWVHSILKFYSENKFVFEKSPEHYEFISVCEKLESP